jgi:predicted permease
MKKPSRAADWLFALALACYPRAFRRRFGAEMRADFREGLAAQPEARLRAACRIVRPLVVDGLSERWAAVRRWPLWPGGNPHIYQPTGRRAMFWESIRSDVGHALAAARKRPGVTALAVLTLALGIGATSAIFTVVNAVLLQPLPYRDAQDLVMIWSSNPREQKPINVVSPANFVDYRAGIQDLAEIEAFASFIISDRLAADEGPEMVLVVNTGRRMFDLLGRSAALGRTFTADDADVVVLSHGYWQRRFGGDPSIVGRSLTIGDTPRTVIGVMPNDFTFPYATMLGPDGFTTRTGVDVWTPWIPERDPFANRSGQLVRNVHYLAVVGRFKEGATREAVAARLDGVARQLQQAYPDSNAGWSTAVVPLHEQAVGGTRPALLLLLVGVGVVLAMASVNVAGLALAQGLGRQREMALRAALGAGRGRLVRQLVTESVLLALAGAAAALLAAQWGVNALVSLAPATIPRLSEVRPDWSVLGVTLLVAVVAGIAIGLVPALTAASPDLRGALSDGARGTAGGPPAARTLRSVLVVAEVALALVLCAGTVLLLRSFNALLSVNPGFTPDGLLTMQVELPHRLTTAEARLAYYDELFERLRGLPGVVAAGGTTRLPLGSTSVSTTIDVEGRPLPDAELPEVQFRRAVDDYFGAMRTPVLQGRTFTRDDGPNSPPVAVINQAMADRLFPNENPVGRRIRTGPNPANSQWRTVIGVVGNLRHTGLEQAPAAEMYISHRQGPPVAPFLTVRTDGDPAALVEPLRAELGRFDRALALFDVKTMIEVRSASVAPRRFLLLLVSAFGVLALVLAAVGVYGVMALVAGERTREMGVRLALGARPRSVLSLLLGQALRLAVAGIALGAAVGWLLSPLIESQLFGVRPADPVTASVVAAVLLAVAVAAALIPARRAMCVDPLLALREE